ncbi:MAG TPA: sulfatase [Bryobacteraceae bacterium]|nr:sulfatase [Bryobacteraceae bacterium]
MKITRRSALAGAAAPAFLQRDAKRTNLLFILSDDHSVPFLGAYGAKWLSTPNVDRFAREGMRFDRMFTSAPQCVPSRTALMTGRSPVAVRMGRFNSPLPPNVATLPEVLRAAGYYTGVCGRYFHLDGVIKAGAVTQAIYETHGLRTWQRRIDYLDTSPQGQTQARFQEFLSKAPPGKPWFFWINYSDPHHPWDMQIRKIDPAAVEVPPYLPDLPGVREDLARYGAEVEHMDSLFEQAIGVLRRSGAEENTLVVFCGDNGLAFPHGKGSLYDPGLNVPLIARWPGRVKAGGSTRALISGEDLAPTLIEAAGAKPPREISGRSFLPLLTGAAYEPRRHIFAARLHHGNSPFGPNTKAAGFDLSRCARSDRWKLIYNCTPHMEYQPVDSARDPAWQQMVAAHAEGKLSSKHDSAYFGRPRPVFELYDLDNDPGELDNVAGRAETAQTQRELMMALQEKMILDYDFLPPPMAE